MPNEDRQRRITEIFLAASELSENERAAYLAAACDGDEQLRAEVESLLAHDDSNSIIGAPGFDVTGKYDTAGNAPLEIPERVGRYRIERALGRGGYGIVCLATDEQLERQVAIKLPHRRFVSTAADAQVYLSEARTVAGLEHPGIVPVYDVGSTDQFPCYVVSRYVEGNDLAVQLRRGGRPDYRRAAELVAIVAEALHYAHLQGLVHRDVKPANILVDIDGQPHLVDFGLALREENIGKGPRYAGTPAYMSPEQARGEGHRVDGRSDIFSLGGVLYQLLTGYQPFSGESVSEIADQIVSREARPPRQRDDQIPRELERICLKALSKRAVDRYLTAQDMADDLHIYLASQDTTETAADSQGTRPGTTARGDALAENLSPTTSSGNALSSDSTTIRIVPKGLRSFDEHDADFFLELLPGPRDRNGLPDSLRFWKSKIEETNTNKTFPVGLIYGPSGCGKSSLVKAGLLPRLSASVKSVYVEATEEHTEPRLLHGIRRQFPSMDGQYDLT
ncbi:MAG: protein kinase domain-containing protein, partial [Pirellulaceae bacterium]